MVTDYGLDALAAIVHETAIEKGFWEGPKNHDKLGNKLALVHSEVTEVLEAIRKNNAKIGVSTKYMFFKHENPPPNVRGPV